MIYQFQNEISLYKIDKVKMELEYKKLQGELQNL